MNRCVIGIDTGGTFTDGVLMNYRTRKVLNTSKTLTTRHDLKRGVITVIEDLNIDNVEDVKMVGVSSTLATNSIAEGKARKTGLLLIGYDRELVESYGLDGKLNTETIGYVGGGHNSQGAEQNPLEEDAVREWLQEYRDKVDAFAVSGYFSPLNPHHEDRVFKIISETTDLPVVMGHQLSTKLDSVKRAATASLNASLVAVMQDFIGAVQKSLKEHGIRAPLMIVRGDGTLMPYTEAIQKPVETVLSGPAASANGGRFLSGNRDTLVIDMGSTTTDMALVDQGQVVVSEKGARVGDTETAVEAARIRTLCIGCDSRIHITREGDVTIGPERVTALSQLASRYAEVQAQILDLQNRQRNTWRESDVEYWFLSGEADTSGLDAGELKLVEELKAGPKCLSELVKALGVYNPGQISADAVFRRGMVEVAAVTPSDILHVAGHMDIWPKEPAHMAVRVLCHVHEKKLNDFVDSTLHSIVDRIAEEAIIFLACQDMSNGEMPYRIDGKWGRWFFDEMVKDNSRFLSVNIDSRYTLLGTGAPAEYFIKRAAQHLSAPFVLPDHYSVANAVGAVSGSVMETRVALVFTQETAETCVYVVQIDEETKSFKEWEEACDYAEEKCAEMAQQAVLEAGASDPYVSVSTRRDSSLLRITARALGNPSLSEDQTSSYQETEQTEIIKGEVK